MSLSTDGALPYRWPYDHHVGGAAVKKVCERCQHPPSRISEHGTTNIPLGSRGPDLPRPKSMENGVGSSASPPYRWEDGIRLFAGGEGRRVQATNYAQSETVRYAFSELAKALRSHGAGEVNVLEALDRFGGRSSLGVETATGSRGMADCSCPSPMDLRGSLVSWAESSCRILHNKAKEEEIQMVLAEVIDHALDLMPRPCGNYFIQKLIHICSEEQMSHLLFSVIDSRLSYYYNHGTIKSNSPMSLPIQPIKDVSSVSMDLSWPHCLPVEGTTIVLISCDAGLLVSVDTRGTRTHPIFPELHNYEDFYDKFFTISTRSNLLFILMGSVYKGNLFATKLASKVCFRESVLNTPVYIHDASCLAKEVFDEWLPYMPTNQDCVGGILIGPDQDMDYIAYVVELEGTSLPEPHLVNLSFPPYFATFDSGDDLARQALEFRSESLSLDRSHLNCLESIKFMTAFLYLHTTTSGGGEI